MAEPDELLFDTGALIDIFRGRPAMRGPFQSLLDGQLKAYLSVVSEAELWRGMRSAEFEHHVALVAAFVSLPLETGSARLAGEWMQRYEASGLGWMDALITATAAQVQLSVLTRDAKLARLLAGEARFELYSATRL